MLSIRHGENAAALSRLASIARYGACAVVAVCAMLTGLACDAMAQSLGDIAAWDALVVSPVGALPPRVHDALFGVSAGAEVSLRYGRWRYDLDDAIHNDVGLTVAHRFGAQTDVAITGAYLSLSCGTCAIWVSGGIDVSEPLFRRTIAGEGPGATTASLDVRASAGAARYRGDGSAAATSVAGATAIQLAFPFAWSSRVAVSVIPGVGIGHLASTDDTAYGTLATLGASVAWAFHSGLVADLGMQRVFIRGGPTQFGLGLAWARQ